MKKNIRKMYRRRILILIFVLSIVTFSVVFKIEISPRWKVSGTSVTADSTSDKTAELEKNIFPVGGEELPVKWGDLGQKLIKEGVIDKETFEGLYAQRGGLNDYEKNLMYGTADDNLKITTENSGFLLNVFWGLGLANKNEILDKGPMQDTAYGGAGSFASTGGWTLARGDAMDHYSKHDFISLTPEQQTLVSVVSKNIYRPCCDNSTYFPDCNHGMAMLGFLELMASQGASEKEMYEAALTLNTYWFPTNYLTIASYFQKAGTPWSDVSPSEALGVNYSSSSGFRQVLSKVSPVKTQGGSGCSV